MQPKFQVIPGGRELPDRTRHYTFLSGFATDTRLMGVLGMYLSWEVQEGDTARKLNQIFYLDCEARIVDTYSESDDDRDIRFINDRARLTATLGGKTHTISEKQARFLVQAHTRPGSRHFSVSEKEKDGYRFLLRPAVTLTPEEYTSLQEILCTPLPSPQFVINYYLMRAAALDTEGLAWLSEPGGYANDAEIHPGSLPEQYLAGPFPVAQPVTYCQNRIEAQPEAHHFLCHSLTERPESYYITSTELTLNEDDTRVIAARRLSEFRITDIEAAMMLRRAEYITIFMVYDDGERFRNAFRMFTNRCTETVYRNGRLFVEFHPHNYHVGRDEYCLNDDVRTVYYLSDQGQLLIMNYTVQAAQETEYHLSLYFLNYGMFLGARYEFPEPVLYEYVNSEFDDFMEFLQYLAELEDED